MKQAASNALHGVISQKIELFMTTVVENLKSYIQLVLRLKFEHRLSSM
jgi:hypothetical protein